MKFSKKMAAIIGLLSLIPTLNVVAESTVKKIDQSAYKRHTHTINGRDNLVPEVVAALFVMNMHKTLVSAGTESAPNTIRMVRPSGQHNASKPVPEVNVLLARQKTEGWTDRDVSLAIANYFVEEEEKEALDNATKVTAYRNSLGDEERQEFDSEVRKARRSIVYSKTDWVALSKEYPEDFLRIVSERHRRHTESEFKGDE